MYVGRKQSYQLIGVRGHFSVPKQRSNQRTEAVQPHRTHISFLLFESTLKRSNLHRESYPVEQPLRAATAAARSILAIFKTCCANNKCGIDIDANENFEERSPQLLNHAF